MKKLMMTLAGLAFCATAWAGDPGANGFGGGMRYGKANSRAKYDQVLGRLSLTDEQIKKIDAIFVACDTKVRDLYKKLHSGDADKRGVHKKYREQQAALNAERDKNIYEVLTAEQQKKYDLAKKIIAEFDAKLTKLRKEYTDIRRLKGDRAKMKEALKKLNAKIRAVHVELQKQLDEKIGKLPKRPKMSHPESPDGVRRGADGI